MIRRYRRFFTMFELEDKNFSIFTGEESRGYAKVEIRNSQGLLSIYCQGLKHSNGNRYQWYLIDTKTDEEPTIVEIGSMEVAERGKGEMVYEFNAVNVNGSMAQIDDFNILVLIVQKKDEEDKLYAPLVGYIDKKRTDVGYWRYALSKYLHIPIDEGTTKEKTAQFYQPAKRVEEEPVRETKKEAAEETIKEPVNEVKEAEAKPVKEIKKETAEKTIKEPMKEEVKEIEEETAEEVVEETVKEPIKETTEEVEIAEEAIKGKVAEETTEQIAEETIEEPVEEIAEEAVEELVEGKAKETEEETAEGAVEEEVREIEEKVVEDVIEEAAEGIIEESAEEPVKEIAEEIEIIEGTIREKAAEETTEETTRETEEETAEGAVKEEVREIEEKVVEDVIEEAAEGIIEESAKEAKEAEEEVAEEAVEEIAEEVIEDEYEIQMQAYIENSLKGFHEVEPFIENLKNYVWWQIPYDVQTMYRAYMPFISYLDSLKEPMNQADYYVSRMAQMVYVHQHHIFGICYDENNRAKYYAYGILGKNLSMEQPFELDEDFVYWHSCDNVPSNIESYGYWILTIDPKTGDAVKCK